MNKQHTDTHTPVWVCVCDYKSTSCVERLVVSFCNTFIILVTLDYNIVCEVDS